MYENICFVFRVTLMQQSANCCAHPSYIFVTVYPDQTQRSKHCHPLVVGRKFTHMLGYNTVKNIGYYISIHNTQSVIQSK